MKYLALGVLLFASGCATTSWQQKVRTALSGAAVASAHATDAVTGDKFCRPFVDACKKAGDTECNQLKRCQMAQVATIQALQAIMQSIAQMNNALVLSEMFQPVPK